MKVDVLHIAECPNGQEAVARTVAALHAIGWDDVPVESVLVSTPEQADATGFAGSPTILVDGVDLFDAGVRSRDLACRVYLTDHGLAGVPTAAQLEVALRARC